jgi:hypothetical protein
MDRKHISAKDNLVGATSYSSSSSVFEWDKKKYKDLTDLQLAKEGESETQLSQHSRLQYPQQS